MLESIREKEILPKGPEDETIPTKLSNLETHRKFLLNQIELLKKEISDNLVQQDILLARAKELHIREDKEYKIVEVPVYPKKSVDVSVLKTFPDKYARIMENIAERIKDKAKADTDKAETFISQADVKAVIRDKTILLKVIPEQTVPERFEISIVKK